MLIGYGRVSGDDQNPALQCDALQAAGCEKIFIEHVSGAAALSDRPELEAAIAFAQPGDILVVWKLDRFARSMLQLLSMTSDLMRRGVGFRCLTQNVDLTSAGGRLMFQMLGAFAEFEREMIKERVNAGIAAARKRGVHCGRPQKISPEIMQKTLRRIAAGDISVAQAAPELGISRGRLYAHVRAGVQ